MKKKEKKLKKNLKQGNKKLKRSTVVADDSVIQTLTDKVKKLKAELNNRDDVIADLQKRLNKLLGKTEKSDKKNRKLKAKGSTVKLLRTQQSARIGVAQKEAWKKHGFLRDRYEYHLEDGQDKVTARALANQDLRESFGDGAGYSKQDLENILS
jgi:seryl-tRNA synthetase